MDLYSYFKNNGFKEDFVVDGNLFKHWKNNLIEVEFNKDNFHVEIINKKGFPILHYVCRYDIWKKHLKEINGILRERKI